MRQESCYKTMDTIIWDDIDRDCTIIDALVLDVSLCGLIFILCS